MIEIKAEDIEIQVEKGITSTVPINKSQLLIRLPTEQAPKLKQQILQDHEDAEDLKVLGGAEYVAEYFIKGEKDRQIVKRLEEHLKEIKDIDSGPAYELRGFIEKILEGKK